MEGTATEVAAEPTVVPWAFKAGKALAGELAKLCGPPKVPMSMSLYFGCCAASCNGNAKTANKRVVRMYAETVVFHIILSHSRAP